MSNEPSTDCLFCRIVSGDISAKIIWDSDNVVAFQDIAPQAPTHILVIPKNHVENLLDTEDSQLLGQWMFEATQVAKHLGLDSFRTVINTGSAAGQSVFHLHLHLLSGRVLGWPPG